MFLRDCRHITTLTFSDLRFEWILSGCMIFALGAVFAPLFILLGLQEGIVGNMLDRLKSDPSSRLVTPKFPVEAPLDDAWLHLLGERSQAVIGSPTSRLLLDIEGLDEPINAVPTTPEDPLLIENGIILSGEGRPIVLSKRLAQISGKKIGNIFTVILVRKVGQEERVPVKFRVAGIAPISASEDAKIWLPETLFQWFYNWRKGQAVPELGLMGRGAVLAPEYDGIVTLLESVPSDEDYRRMLAGKMGFNQLPQPLLDTGWKLPLDRQVRLWRAINSRVFESDFAPLVNRHHELGYTLEAVPFLESFDVMLKAGVRTERLSLTILPPALGLGASAGDPEGMPRVWVSPENGFEDAVAGEMSFDSGNKGIKITIPVKLSASHMVTPGHLAVPRDLAGKMNAARHQEAAFDPARGEFTPMGAGMRFFRAYARSIDELEELVEFVRQEGVKRASNALREPSSKVEEVRNIRRLAGYMEQLYFLIVVVCGVSGFFAIAANVYAGVQRKRRDLSYLALLGMHPAALFLFPCLKSLVLVTGGVVSALVAYVLFGHLSDRLFAQVLGDAGSLTRLTVDNIMILLSGIFTAASLASLLAATAVTRIEPGEYIRE